MPTIAREQANTPDLLNWFTVVGMARADMYEIGFQVWDLTGGSPGVQIFPAVGGTWEDATTGVGHYGTGYYYAYDSALAAGWTPGAAANLGDWQIKWRWKVNAGSGYQYGEEDFVVGPASSGSALDSYCSLQDVRDAGLTPAMATDAEVLAAIELWQQVLERACRQWFRPRELTLQFDGSDSDTAFFGVPIIAVEHLKINDSADALDASFYKVYSGTEGIDDRGNPRICLVRWDGSPNIFAAPVETRVAKFRKGRKNQEVKGTFGYIQPDGSCPKPIWRALLKLVIAAFRSPIGMSGGGSSPPVLGSVLSETTDGHSISYGSPGGNLGTRRVGLSGIIPDPEVQDIIKLYRAPLGVATPANWSYT